MPDTDSIERSSAKYAAIVAYVTLALYGGAAGLWAVSSMNVEEPAVALAAD